MEISSFGLVCEYVNCSDVRISCNNCMWSGTIISQRGGGVSQHILAPKIIWRYFVQNQGGNWDIYLRDPPWLKWEIIPNPLSCYQGRCQNAQNAQTRGGDLLFHAGGCVHSVLMASIPLLPNGLIFFSEIGPFWAKRFKTGLILDVFLDVLL